MRFFLDDYLLESGMYLVQYSSWSTGKTVDLQSINLREPSELRLYKKGLGSNSFHLAFLLLFLRIKVQS